MVSEFILYLALIQLGAVTAITAAVIGTLFLIYRSIPNRSPEICSGTDKQRTKGQTADKVDTQPHTLKSITSFPPPSRLSRRSLLAYLSKALPNLTVDTTSSVKPSTTLYVHIFAFDLARAVRYAVHSVGKESSLIQWSGASCICMVNRLNASGVRGEYNRRKAGLLLVVTSMSLR